MHPHPPGHRFTRAQTTPGPRQPAKSHLSCQQLQEHTPNRPSPVTAPGKPAAGNTRQLRTPTQPVPLRRHSTTPPSPAAAGHTETFDLKGKPLAHDKNNHHRRHRGPSHLRRVVAGVLISAIVTAGAAASATAGQAADRSAAARYLTALAAHLQPAEADQQTAGTYRLIEAAVWYRQGDPTSNAGAIIGKHIRRWVGADRSGRVITEQTRRPRGFDMTSVGQATAREIPAETVTVEDHPPQTMPPAGGIRTQLLGAQAWQQHRPPGCTAECVPFGPYELVDALANLHTIDLFDIRERAAFLNILAAVPGLRYGGTAIDTAGRTDAVVSLDTDGCRRLVLIVDRRTGELVAYQRWIHGHGLHTHVLFVHRARTSQLDDVHGPNVTRIPISPRNSRT